MQCTAFGRGLFSSMTEGDRAAVAFSVSVGKSHKCSTWNICDNCHRYWTGFAEYIGDPFLVTVSPGHSRQGRRVAC